MRICSYWNITSRMLQSYCPNSVIILLSFLWLPFVLQPSKQTFALWSYGDRFSVISSSVMNAATGTWKNGLTMMYPLTKTGLPLCFSQRSLVFYSVFSLQILVFFFLWRTRYSTRLQRLIRLSMRNEISSHKLWLIALRSSGAPNDDFLLNAS